MTRLLRVSFALIALFSPVVLLAQAPAITGLSAHSAPVGALVTVIGSNFGAAQGASTVTFNGTAATPTKWSATSITVPVPAGATTGNVVVTVGGDVSNGVMFTVTAPSALLRQNVPTIVGCRVDVLGFTGDSKRARVSVVWSLISPNS
jgi:IPT/TIG domain